MTTQPVRREAHPYYMHDMIIGEPDAVNRMLSEERAAVESLAGAVVESERVHVVGIGTSWHAAFVGEWLLRVVGGREDARAWNSFEFCAYPPNLSASDIVIVMSHRGTKMYSAQSLERAKSSGARTGVVTGLDSGVKSDLADHIVRTSIQDKSSAFTISHTGAMTALAMLASAVGAASGQGTAKDLGSALQELPAQIEKVIAKEAEIKKWAARSKDSDRFYFMGWGPNAATAYEAALKIKESSYLRTEGFQLEQYLHGPFVATERGTHATFIVPQGFGRTRATDLMQAARETGASTPALIEEGDTEIGSLVDMAISLPLTPEPLTPIVYLTALQLFTYWLAVERGTNPDLFRLDDPAHLAAREKYQL